MPNPWFWTESKISELKASGLHRSLRRRESPPVSGRSQIAGSQLLTLGSTDSLGLAADGRLVDAV
ncbi:MAG: 8-amino-7-oxononanoate synthase, partial [Planctomycetota bacterium]|nr:8-amino-7-oxononanoate synthase [Planctomycetota bacterium]